MIKNVIFDIGGVLAYPKSGNWFITPNFYHILNRGDIDEECLLNSLKKFLYLQTQDPKTEEEEFIMFSNYYYQVLNDIHYPNTTIELANKIAEDCVFNDEKFSFYEDVQDSLEKLSEKYNLYIISNGWPSSLRVLENRKLHPYFKDIIISSLYTTDKENNLFPIFLEKHKEVLPEESIFIDDRKHILEKASTYHFHLLLMDRDYKYPESKFLTVHTMEDIFPKI